jgi:large subunit ribosomal protein L25
MITLKAVEREKGAKKINERVIPAVLYGGGEDNKSLWIDFRDFKRTYEEAGESTLVDLKVSKEEKGTEGKGQRVLIYDVQYHPVLGSVIHVDFYRVTMGQKLDTEVRLNFVGVSPAAKEQGGVLVKSVQDIEIRCLPKDLPSEIEVDVSSLQTFDDYIYAKDLPVGEEIEMMLEPETVIAFVAPPRSEAELEELEQEVEADASAIETTKEKKSEEESEKPEENKQ